MGQKPSVDDPAEARKAHELIKRKSNVPKGHVDGNDLRKAHAEELSPAPTSIADSELAWFFPALAYCMVGLDRSLFELYAAYLDKEFQVVTHRAENPVATFDGADIRGNSWFYTVQGISTDLASDFGNYISTFQFNNPRNGSQWSLTPKTLRVADPFQLYQREGVWLTLFLPNCLTGDRSVQVVRSPGLQLGELQLGVRKGLHDG